MYDVHVRASPADGELQKLIIGGDTKYVLGI
jgi:hypothetical protein